MGNRSTNSKPPEDRPEHSRKDTGKLTIGDEAAAALAYPLDVPRMRETLASLFPVGVIVVDAAGEIVSSNPEAHDMLGGQLTGDAFGPTAGYELCVPDGEAFAPEDLPLPRSLLKGETVRGEEVLVRLADGSTRSILVSSVPIRDDNATITGAVAIFQDISRQKQTELLLRETEERFRVLADSAPVMIWMSDETGGCTFFNNRWVSFTGRPLNALAGDGWLDDVHPEDLA